MTVLELVAWNAAILAVPLLSLWLLSLLLRDVSIIDIFWGAGYVIVAWSTLLLAGEPEFHQYLVVALTTIWGLRLSAYLAWRNIGSGEDYRYRKMRERAGPAFRWRSLITIFGLQGALILIVSLPVQAGQLHGAASSPTALHAVGIALWAIGMFFESVGDWQLARFKARPDSKGKVMDQGLWRYTRHPNYFGDFMVWWGLFLASMATLDTGLDIAWTVVGPIVMSILLVRVSGVALLESEMRKRREGYEDYVRRTSAFFPWPPRE